MKKVLIPACLIVAALWATTIQAEKILSFPKPDGARSSEPLSGSMVEAPAALSKFLSPRIVGGGPAGPNDYPEFVELYVDGSEIGGDPDAIYPICGASLISSNKVLTAAHCTVDFPAFNLYVVPKFYTFSGLTSGDFFQVSSKAVHPSYHDADTGYDISVLTLNAHASSALASVYAGSNGLTGFNSTVIGTGRLSEGGSSPSTLYKVNVPIVSNAVCSASYAGYGINISGTMICAGFAGGGKDSCQGDSGGPLWVTYEGKKVQAGIVSFGIGCAQPLFYGVYARTSALIDFIRQHAPNTKVVTGAAPIMAPVVNILLNQ